MAEADQHEGVLAPDHRDGHETFGVNVSIEHDTLVIAVCGSVTADGAEVIERLLDRSDAIDLPSVVVDLTNAAFDGESIDLTARPRRGGHEVHIRKR